MWNTFFLTDFVFFYLLILSIVALYPFFLVDRHLIVILMTIEMVFLVISMMFVLIGFLVDDLTGNIFTFFILGIAAVESVIGLALLLVFYRLRAVISVDIANFLKG